MGIIALTGFMGSGKNTAADIIQRFTRRVEGQTMLPGHGRFGVPHYVDTFEQKAFASGVRQVAHIFLPQFDYEFLFTIGFKETFLPDWGMTGREFLQKLGTEAIRDGLHKDAWCNMLMSQYTPEIDLLKAIQAGGKAVESQQYPHNWIITDMRFPNEYEAVKKIGGIVVRISRGAKTEEDFKNMHESETAILSCVPDYLLFNDGTLQELETQLSNLLKELKII